MVINSTGMILEVTPRKAEIVHDMSKKLRNPCIEVQCYVIFKLVRQFCGLCIYLTLATPWSRYLKRSMFDSLSTGRSDSRVQVALNHQDIRALRFWKKLANDDSTWTAIQPLTVQETAHTDASDVGYGGMLNLDNLTAVSLGLYINQEVWKWKERAIAIYHWKLWEMQGLRQLKRLLGILEIGVKSRWLPSALNRYTDSS